MIMGEIPEGRKPLDTRWFSKWLKSEDDDPCDDWSKNSLDSKPIRELDEEEKQRSKEREKKNGKYWNSRF